MDQKVDALCPVCARAAGSRLSSATGIKPNSSKPWPPRSSTSFSLHSLCRNFYFNCSNSRGKRSWCLTFGTQQPCGSRSSSCTRNGRSLFRMSPHIWSSTAPPDRSLTKRHPASGTRGGGRVHPAMPFLFAQLQLHRRLPPAEQQASEQTGVLPSHLIRPG